MNEKLRKQLHLYETKIHLVNLQNINHLIVIYSFPLASMSLTENNESLSKFRNRQKFLSRKHNPK